MGSQGVNWQFFKIQPLGDQGVLDAVDPQGNCCILAGMAWKRAWREATLLGALALGLAFVAHRWLSPEFPLSEPPRLLHDRPVIPWLPSLETPADTHAYLGARPTLQWLRSGRAYAVSAVPVPGLPVWNPDQPETWLSQVVEAGRDTIWILADSSLFYQKAWRLQRILQSLGFQRAWVTEIPANQLAKLLGRSP